MAKPIVAMVGRPNVGKSTLFNKIAGKRISIVEDTPGVTRDRVYAEAEWLNYNFTMSIIQKPTHYFINSLSVFLFFVVYIVFFS